jgi:hypothetical protein
MVYEKRVQHLYKCTTTFRMHCIWLGHEAPRFCNLGTMDECTATWPEFDLTTELSPLTNALHSVM